MWAASGACGLSGVAWSWPRRVPPQVHDASVQPLLQQCEAHILILTALACHAAAGEAAHWERCERGEWPDRMRIETVRSRRMWVSHFRRMMHRIWEYCATRLVYTMAAVHVLAPWHGVPVDKQGSEPSLWLSSVGRVPSTMG